jgi:two-component system CheB/CheR fusion protein
VRVGIIALDINDLVVSHNEAAIGIWKVSVPKLLGKRLQNTDLILRCPELPGRLEASRGSGEAITFNCSRKANGEEYQIAVTLRPVLTENGQRAGTLIYAEDITDREKLQSTIEQLEATSEELQSANEELETTNEELQSTNEELETTNEELQSTNDELETTNEELQSLNEELENMNDELEHRTQELHQLNSRYAETLQSMPWPVLMVDRAEKIQLWNAAAQRVFGVGATSVVGADLDHLPIDAEVRKSIVRRCRLVMEKGKASVLREQRVRFDHEEDAFDLHVSPVARADGGTEGVLIMFGPAEVSSADRTAPAANSKAPRNQRSGNSQAAKKKPAKSR